MSLTRIMAVVTSLLVVFSLLSCAPAKIRKSGSGGVSSTVQRVRDKSMRTRKVSRARKIIPRHGAVGHNIEVTLSRSAPVDNLLNVIISRRMDKYDREQLNHVYERGVSGQIASWTNPELGNQYRVTPYLAYQGAMKRACREAEVKVMINVNDGIEQINTTACRDRNGQWRIQRER